MSLVDLDCGHGIVLKYDPTIKPGDIITAYHKGFWKVTDVVQRGKKNTPYIRYDRIGKKGSNSCDASYCRKVDPEALYQSMIDEAGRVRDMLMKALEVNK